MFAELSTEEPDLAYTHFDFHHRCGGNSEPMSEEIQNKIYPEYGMPAGMFMQFNELIQTYNG